MVRRLLVLIPVGMGILTPIVGCGGGGGNSLTGGSVPIGGRAVTGIAILPDSTPVANATVTVRTLPGGAIISSTKTDSSGRFTLSGVTSSGDIDILVAQPPTNQLEAVVSKTTLEANPNGTLDIGNVTALSSLVAAAIKLEQVNSPEDANSIVENQSGHLSSEVTGKGYSPEAQKQLISDRNSINAQALTLMVPVANSELQAMDENRNSDTASSAMNGLLGYMRAAHNREFHLDGGRRQSLISAEVAGTIFTSTTIAQALEKSGIKNVTPEQVSAASDRERAELTAFGANGTGITAFEAYVIAADVNTNGGFQCDQSTLDNFVQNLLKH